MSVFPDGMPEGLKCNYLVLEMQPSQYELLNLLAALPTVEAQVSGLRPR